jgi:serine/threonine protein kinase
MVAAVEVPVPVLAAGAALSPGYRVLGLLSRNDALDVYDVWSEERGVRCVAKVVRPDRVGEAHVRERLRMEARLLLGFTHPNIVRAYELVEEPALALILETLSGVTLEALIDGAVRRLPATDLAHLTAQLGSALGYVHGHGVVHLDVKPSNVIAQWGQAKLIDFSLARPAGTVPPGVGTRDYLAPEQARGEHVDGRTDVWGLGMTVFEAAAGDLPFAFDDPADRYPQLTRHASPIRAFRRLPHPLADLVDACLEAEPARRPSVPEVIAVARSLVDVAPPAAVPT